MGTLQEAGKRFERWFVSVALPLWIERGYDHHRGGFYEALNFDATPSCSRPRRVRVQARQIHTLSQAGIMGWHDGAEALAAEGFGYLLEKACPEDGTRGCAHLINDDGVIIDDRRDLYDQAFLLLACASRWQAAKDERALALAQRTVNFLDWELASPHGGWLESNHKELPRRQNPHMHLFEAFIALYQATKDEHYFQKARIIIKDCFAAFFDESDGVIIEYFNEDLSRHTHHTDIAPGHMFEWTWLLRIWERLSGANFKEARNTLYAHGARMGEDLNFHGFVANQVDIKALQQASAKRLWPQTEYLKASCIQGAEGDEQAREKAAGLISAMFATYLDVDCPGLWVDEFDEKGAPAASDVPASILYHVYEAVAEVSRTFAAEEAS